MYVASGTTAMAMVCKTQWFSLSSTSSTKVCYIYGNHTLVAKIMGYPENPSFKMARAEVRICVFDR